MPLHFIHSHYFPKFFLKNWLDTGSTFLSVFHFQKLLTTEMDRSRKMRQQVISLPSMLLLMSWLGGLVHHIAWIIVRSHCIVWISAFWHFCHWHSYKSPASNLPLNVHCHSYYGIVPSTALHCHAIGYCQLPQCHSAINAPCHSATVPCQ